MIYCLPAMGLPRKDRYKSIGYATLPYFIFRFVSRPHSTSLPLQELFDLVRYPRVLLASSGSNKVLVAFHKIFST